MELLSSRQEIISRQFDSFCKKVLREEMRNYVIHISWRAQHEVSLSELSEEQIERFYILDEYPSDYTKFDAQGYSIIIKNRHLAQALATLSEDRRDILLLAYFLDMTDQEIGEKMNIIRRTVQYKRTSSLKEMKRRMEVRKGDDQSEE